MKFFSLQNSLFDIHYSILSFLFSLSSLLSSGFWLLTSAFHNVSHTSQNEGNDLTTQCSSFILIPGTLNPTIAKLMASR